MRIDDLERELREALVAAGRLLHERGLLAGTAGNLSARLPDGRVLVTPRGVRKDRLDPGALVTIRPDAPDPSALAAATTEWPLHAACYGTGPGVGAVVHTHAPALTALGLGDGSAHVRLAEALPEVAEAIGGLAVVPFAPSGSEALARAAAGAVKSGAAVLLLSRHGAASVAPDPWAATDRMELAELAARTLLLAE